MKPRWSPDLGHSSVFVMVEKFECRPSKTQEQICHGCRGTDFGVCHEVHLDQMLRKVGKLHLKHLHELPSQALVFAKMSFAALPPRQNQQAHGTFVAPITAPLNGCHGSGRHRGKMCPHLDKRHSSGPQQNLVLILLYI